MAVHLAVHLVEVVNQILDDLFGDFTGGHGNGDFKGLTEVTHITGTNQHTVFFSYFLFFQACDTLCIQLLIDFIQQFCIYLIGEECLFLGAFFCFLSHGNPRIGVNDHGIAHGFFCARRAKKVVGVEYVPEAIEDAKVNSAINGIENTSFYAGDMKDVLSDDFVARNGRPDVIILDPPRAGVDERVIEVILRAAPERIVYVSCNPATQARDIALMDGMYRVESVQPVDMFPHTYHVENVVKLVKR